MARRLPCILRRPFNLIHAPEADVVLESRRPGFLHGDPRPWAPAILSAWDAAGAEAPLPYTPGCDLLLAPAPLPGHETETLLAQLRSMPASRPVALYERDRTVWPNLLLTLPAHDGDAAESVPPATAGLRAYRSAFRHRGAIDVDALAVMPARRLARLLRGSWLAALRGGGPLLDRRFLQTALDHERTLAIGARYPGSPALPGARRIAVVMPHFDDEVLQCGGMILQARAKGAEVRIIWLTDGAQGIAESVGAESARIRKQEARAAAAALGVEDVHFLDAPETQLSANCPQTTELGHLLADFEPERVHLTWWLDNHVDHYEANRMARDAWPQRLKNVPICASGAWTPLPFGATVPIEPEHVEPWEQAFRCHASQLKEVDYIRAGRGLGAWYAQSSPRECPSGQAERYWVLPAAEYWARFHESGVDRRIWRG